MLSGYGCIYHDGGMRADKTRDMGPVANVSEVAGMGAGGIPTVVNLDAACF